MGDRPLAEPPARKAGPAPSRRRPESTGAWAVVDDAERLTEPGDGGRLGADPASDIPARFGHHFGRVRVHAGAGASSDVTPPASGPGREEREAAVEGVVEPVADDQGAGPEPVDEAGEGTQAESAPARRGLASPQPAPWASVAGVPDDGSQAIVGPSGVPLPTIQAPGGGNPWRLGWTSFPLATAKAPEFEFNLTKEWMSRPTLKQAAYEGDNVCWFLPKGTHKTTHVEGGKPVYWVMSGPMAARDSAAEAEHSNDIKRAYKISLKEAQKVLDSHVVGKTFGPKPTEAEAKQLVLDRITSKLTHAALGNDQTKWAATYETLYRKTLQRDNKGWHTFRLDNRRTNAAGDVLYDVRKGTTKVNQTKSATLIVY